MPKPRRKALTTQRAAKPEYTAEEKKRLKHIRAAIKLWEADGNIMLPAGINWRQDKFINDYVKEKESGKCTKKVT